MTPGTRLGPYEILSKLGEGGMGDVYRAHDSRLGRDVALKFSKEQFTERFEREARAVAALNHPNICTLHDVGPNYLVMEYIEGESPKGPLPLQEALRIARQIADALEAAHEKDIVHRDLKPANIKIKPDGTVKVLDFGLATLGAVAGADPAESPTMLSTPTQFGMVLGTAAYMAPEQARGKTVDKRADIWAFGVVLYELLTGERLFSGETVSDVLAAVLTKEPDLSAAPPKARRLLDHCLQKDRKNRLRDIGDWQLLLMIDSSVGGATRSRSLFAFAAWIVALILAIGASLAVWGAWRSPVLGLKRVARFALDFDHVGAPTGGPDLVISPDGRRLAYISQDRLFVRKIDESQATELVTGDEVSNPFFSPDGESIAFYAGGKLKRISVTGGGAPATICESAFFMGGSWGEDGGIVYSPGQVGGLYKVPAGGGTPVPITQLDLARRERTHRWPQVLPGSSAVLFTSNTNSVGGFDQGSIEAVFLKDGRRKVVLNGGTFGRYIAASENGGYLIYLNRGTLFAAPFDPRSLEIRGSPAAILEHVIYNAGNGGGKLAFSRDGTLLFESGDSNAGLVTVAWLEHDGKTNSIFVKPGHYGRPRLSPDGRRLAVEVSDGPTQDIWVRDFERETMTRLTFDGKANQGPLWSPDGRSIVFSGADGLASVRADGAGSPQSLLRSNGTAFPYSFTPDGKALAFMQLALTTAYDLWILPLEGEGASIRGGKPSVLLQTSFDERYPTLSPDGRWLAYSSNESGEFQVYVRAFHRDAPLNGKWQVSNGGGSYPMWSGNGRELSFESLDSRIMMAEYAVKGDAFLPDKPRLWSDKQLSRLVNSSKNLDLAPDGKRFIVVLPADERETRSRTQITLLEGFLGEVQRRVPERK